VKSSKMSNSQPSGWDNLKSVVYGSADIVGSLTEKIKGGSQESDVQGGYSSVERSIFDSASPGQRLMNEYRARSFSSSSSSAQSPSSFVKVKTEPAPTRSAFDTFKGAVYGSVDAASQVLSGDSNDNKERLESFKPLVQPTLSSPEIQQNLQNLDSNNIIKRKIAEGKIKNWEEEEKKRQRTLEREEAARKFKESVYQVGDAVVATAEALSTIPSKLSKAAEGTARVATQIQNEVEKVPTKVDTVVSSVASIPVKVESTVKTTVEATTKTAKDVASIPTKIKTSVKETQQKVNAAVETVDEVTTKLKVMAGLEKPVPKPPKTPPPPPPTAAEIARKIAGDVVKGAAVGTAKATWWVGKSAAVAAWNGVQAATGNVKNEVQLGPSTNRSTPMVTESSASKASDATTPSPTDSDVDKEVQEALRLAQSAIDFADKDAEKSKKE